MQTLSSDRSRRRSWLRSCGDNAQPNQCPGARAVRPTERHVRQTPLGRETARVTHDRATTGSPSESETHSVRGMIARSRQRQISALPLRQ